MNRVVEWSVSALDDLEAAIGYIAARDPAAARRIALAIDNSARKLGTMPIGRPGRVRGTHEKSVDRWPYVIAYAIAPEEESGGKVVILRVIHTARDWPQGGWPGD